LGIAGLNVSRLSLARATGSAFNIRGEGRGRLSPVSDMARLEVVDRTLEADKFLLCPLLYALWPPLLAVEALGLTFGGRTRSVRICLWNLVPVAARESPGISSLTCTVCAC
jgi:hypothetical protein